jgi:hypothetical protein
MLSRFATATVLTLATIAIAVAAPGGSYRETCRRVEQQGPILRALCRDRSGNFAATSLDLRDCDHGDISNRNGRLVCVGGRGHRRY